MSELQIMLAEMVERLLKDLEGQSSPWDLIEQFGLTQLMLPEVLDGFNGNWRDARIVFELLGKHAVALPIGETILACKYIHESDMEVDDKLLSGIIGIGHCSDAVIDTRRQTFSGILMDPVSSSLNGTVDRILVEATVEGKPQLLLLNAGDARDGSNFTNVSIHFSATPAANQPTLLHAGALLRTAQISGAMSQILAMSVQYVNERSQFGRPLAKFQAIQHNLAILAEQAAAVQCSTQAACMAADYDPGAFEIAAAKLRANMAIPDVCSITHQVHGAIGFTEEYPLHHFTRRLAAWRTEFGNDRFWANALGKIALDNSESGIWQFLTGRGDAIAENCP